MRLLGQRRGTTHSDEADNASATIAVGVGDGNRLPIVRQDGVGQRLAYSQPRRLRVRHCSEGRIRLRLAALRDDAGLTDRLRAALEADPEIVGVRINRACASLVIHHQRVGMSQEALVADVSALLARLLAESDTCSSGPVEHSGAERSGAEHSGAGRRELRAQRASQGQAKGTALMPKPPSRRPAVTWPLADLATLKTEEHEHLQGQSLRTAKTAASNRRPRGLRLGRFRTNGCWLCGLHRWMTRWYLRLSLRCWWRGPC